MSDALRHLRPRRSKAEREEKAVVDRLLALIIPGNPDEQRARRLRVIGEIRRGYVTHWGGEPPWLLDLHGRVMRDEPLRTVP